MVTTSVERRNNLLVHVMLFSLVCRSCGVYSDVVGGWIGWLVGVLYAMTCFVPTMVE